MKTDFDCHKKLAFASPEAIAAKQSELLQAHIRYCQAHSPYYRKHLAGIDPATVALSELPLTDKADISESNMDFLAVEPRRISDIVFSSGTSGIPTQVMYTDNDLWRLAYNEQQAFAACGIGADDIILLTCTMDRCFIAGLAYFMGGCATGAAMIRNGHGTLESHRDVIRRTQPTVVIGVPSFLRKLGQYMLKRGDQLEALSVKKMVCIGEPLRDRNMMMLSVGRDLETQWGAKAYSTYASSEMVTTFCDCEEQLGGHLHPDLGIVEIVDKKGQVVPDGEQGEVVVTPLQVEGMPLIRFRTGDISFLLREPCKCGRNTPRLGPIVGRKNQLLKVHGTSIYPQAVFAVLDEIPEVREYYLVVEREAELADRLIIHLALRQGPIAMQAVLDELQGRLRVKPEIIVEQVEDIRRIVFTPESRKPVRFIDRRA